MKFTVKTRAPFRFSPVEVINVYCTHAQSNRIRKSVRNGIWSNRSGCLQKGLRGDQKGQEAQVRGVSHQGREADRHRGDRRAQLYLRPVPRRPTKGRPARMPLRSV